MLGLFILTSCSSSNTPSGVAEKAMKCMQQKDYAGFVDLMYYEPEKAPTEEEKKQAEALISAKASEAYEKQKGGIKSYEVVSEKITEDGNEAAVKMKIVYNNGDEDEDNFSLKKNKEGKWLVDIGK